MPDFVIITAGGNGVRFKEFGFKKPKPFINIFGRSQVEWAISSSILNYPNAKLIVSYRSGLRYRILVLKLRLMLRGVKIQFVDIGISTRGASETVAKTITEILNREQRDFSFVVADNDLAVVLSTNIDTELIDVGLTTTISDNPGHSYLVKNESGRVQHIAEKKRISDLGIVGNYYFRSAADFILQYQLIESIESELYISKVVEKYLSSSYFVIASSCDRVLSFGTPDEISKLKSEDFDSFRGNND